MIRWALIMVLFLTALDAKSMEAQYTIQYGLFGQMGVADAKYVAKEGQYQIDMIAKTTGMARFLSGGREEFFESRGVVENGLLKPLEYRHKVVKSSQEPQGLQGWKSVEKVSETIYEFNHNENLILKKKIKSKDGQVYGLAEEKLDYYALNDLLTLFFNFSLMVEDLDSEKVLYAVGANKKDGSLHVKYLGQNGDEKEYLAILNEPIFASKDGALHVSLDADGLCSRAVLKDVLLFGDIRAIRNF